MKDVISHDYNELRAAYEHVCATREDAIKEIIRLERQCETLLAACKAAHGALLTFEQLGLMQQGHEQRALELVRAALATAHDAGAGEGWNVVVTMIAPFLIAASTAR